MSTTRLKSALPILYSMSLITTFLAWLACTIQSEQLVANAQENTGSQGQPIETSYNIAWCNYGGTPFNTALRYLDKGTNSYISWKHSETLRTLQPSECRRVSISSKKISDSGFNIKIYIYKDGKLTSEQFRLGKDFQCYAVDTSRSNLFKRSSCNFSSEQVKVKFWDD
ncbi:hypothetical protein BZZ01_10620 [Nostocales cyanobacterium HT-58-2]|nr:hypothetical protein BZZ01_10620 [Nostocales cyanobacterium HT-58-2]